MKEVYIMSAVRTPVGSFGGSLKDFSATQLGAIAIKGALQKANVNPELVNDVLMGCVLQAGLGQNPARQAALKAGLPDSIARQQHDASGRELLGKRCEAKIGALLDFLERAQIGDSVSAMKHHMPIVND